MNKYKVEFTESQKYIVDVLAKDEQEAKQKASIEWDKITDTGTEHYHLSVETETEISTVYDVTNTEDPFNP